MKNFKFLLVICLFLFSGAFAAPQFSSVSVYSSNTNPTFAKTGDILTFTLTLNSADNANGTGQITFAIGSAVGLATTVFPIKSTSTTHTVTYTVLAGQNGNISVSGITFKNSLAEDIQNLPAFPYVPASNVSVDTLSPVFQQTTAQAQNSDGTLKIPILGTYYVKSGEKIYYTLSVDPADTWESGGHLTFDVGAVHKQTGNFTQSTTPIASRNKTYTVLSGDNGVVAITGAVLFDQAGNSISGVPNPFPATNIVADTSAPTIIFTDDVDMGPVMSDTITITVNDSNPETTTYQYAFKNDIDCGTAVYGTTFTSGVPFVISTETNNGKYICAKAVDLLGNIAYLASTNPLNIDTTPPILLEVTAVPTLTKDNTPDYTFNTTESGTILYSGDCSGANTDTVFGNKTITFNTLSDGVHSNCQIKVTDTAGNSSGFLTVSAFTVDTTPPIVNNVSIFSNNPLGSAVAKTNDTITLTFTVSDALSTNISLVSGGTILNKSITSHTVATVGAGSIQRFTDGTETSETIVPFGFKVSDEAGNESALVSGVTDGTSVKFDRTNPMVQEVKISAVSADASAFMGDAPTYYAKQGDTVNFELQICDYVDSQNNPPSGTIFGQALTLINGGLTGNSCITPEGNTSGWRKWTAQLLGVSGAEGIIEFEIIAKDNAGNILANITGTTDESRVIFDTTAPSLPTDVSDTEGVATAFFKHRNRANFSWTNDADPSGADFVSGVFKYAVRFFNPNTGINESSIVMHPTKTFVPTLVTADNNAYIVFMNIFDKSGNASGESTVYTQKYGIGALGTVWEESSGQAIPNVLVQVVAASGEVCDTGKTICTGTTDATGNYGIVLAPNQSYKIDFISAPNRYMTKSNLTIITDDVTTNAWLSFVENLQTQTTEQVIRVETALLFSSGDRTIKTNIWVKSESGEAEILQNGEDILVTSFGKITEITSNNPAVTIIDEGGNQYRVKNVGKIGQITDAFTGLKSVRSAFSSGETRLAVKRIFGNGSSGGFSGFSLKNSKIPGAPGTFATYQESLAYAELMNQGAQSGVSHYVNENNYPVFSGYQSGKLPLSFFARFENPVLFRGRTNEFYYQNVEETHEAMIQKYRTPKQNNQNFPDLLGKQNRYVSLKLKNEEVPVGFSRTKDIFSSLSAKENYLENKVNKFERKEYRTMVPSRMIGKSLENIFLNYRGKGISLEKVIP